VNWEKKSFWQGAFGISLYMKTLEFSERRCLVWTLRGLSWIGIGRTERAVRI
jgi:hypothetical protein